MYARKRVAVIGATGSVGAAALDICARFPERFEVTALAAYSNKEKLLRLARQFGAATLCLAGVSSFAETGYRCLSGVGGLSEMAVDDGIDHVVFASSGVDAVWALRDALIAGKEVSLSNKESIVAAGQWIMPLVRKKEQLRPVDSEHSALWQCLREESEREIEKVWLTASGGPFKDAPAEELEKVTPEQALCHPVWPMGAKITIDSATLMNKGIECIEAMRLFGLGSGQVDALVHPGSQAHALALFSDGTTKMLISPADMRLPAAAALSYPSRLNLIESGLGFISPEKMELKFSGVDMARFPCFALALEAGRLGGGYPALMIGADETAVGAFLKKRIGFSDIHKIISDVLCRWNGSAPANIEDALALVKTGERMAEELC